MRLSCISLFFLLIVVTIFACGTDDDGPMQVVEYDDTPYVLSYGTLPDPPLPTDNALTEQKVLLGRMLFYEPLLSKDGSQACASCHLQTDGFSDPNRFSLGVEGLVGNRQAMPVFNLAWHTNAFFWDGRAELLRDQALLPIQDPLEMNETMDNVIAKLSASKQYTDQFIRAFDSAEITADKMGLALEQFMLSVVSVESKYDRWLAGEVELSESEERGRQLFTTEYNPFFPEFSGADCQHCHSGKNFENDQYMNNGLDTDAEFTDPGRELVTGDPLDRAKFKVPSLRNIELTAPYMHDGRFQTLEEVIDHYNAGIKASSTADPTVENTRETGLFLTEQDKQDLINFLRTFTDENLSTNPAYQSPF
ncbi:MAG: cytochrome c peroxidase [Bacteroidota bacterium]